MRMMMYGCPPTFWRHPLSDACRATLITTPDALYETGQLCKKVCDEIGLGEYPTCSIGLLVETPFAAVSVYEDDHKVPVGVSSDIHNHLAHYRVSAIMLGGVQGPWEYAPHTARVAIGTNAPFHWAKCSGNMDAGLVLTLSEPTLIEGNEAFQFTVLLPRAPTHTPVNLTKAWSRTVAVASF